MKLTRPPRRRHRAQGWRRYFGPVQCWRDGRVQEGELKWTTREPGGVLMHRRTPVLIIRGEEVARSECAWLRIATDPEDLRGGDWVADDGVDALLVEVRLDGLGGAQLRDDDGRCWHAPAGVVVWRYDAPPAEPRRPPRRTAHLDPDDPFAGMPGT